MTVALRLTCFAALVKLTQPLVLDSELLDYYCLENEKSLVHMIKK